MQPAEGSEEGKEDRLKEEPPFTHCGVDIFDSFLIKERRNTLKQFGAHFVCLASPATHIEIIKNMDTDSFISALRRFTQAWP